MESNQILSSNIRTYWPSEGTDVLYEISNQRGLLWEKIEELGGKMINELNIELKLLFNLRMKEIIK